MALRVERVRRWLLVGAALLVVVIGGFIGYARFRLHRSLAGLPGRLGIDVRRETDGYTYSQSVKGKTVMTLHAAKAVEHTDGKITLHDVWMVLYGRKQDRQDRISGAEFEYEQKTGVVRAVGEVHIDLQAPPSAEGRGGAGTEGGRVVHIKTSGLVYLQSLGVAATDQALEFQFGGATGHAVGAEYNSDTGVLVLQSTVQANGVEAGQPVALTASHAELERESDRAVLTEARYASGGRTAQAGRASVHLRKDGSPERVEAEGDVVIAEAGGSRVAAPHADLQLSAASRAQSLHLSGGVRYEGISTLREGRGEAEDARVAFDVQGRAETVLLSGAVQVKERVRSGAAAGWDTRDGTAGSMRLMLADDGERHRTVRAVEADRGARVTVVSAAGTARMSASELAGDTVRGRFGGAGKSMALTELHAVGHTSLKRKVGLGGGGAEQTSVGDALDVEMRAARPGQGRREEIARAIQTGHVVVTSRPAAKAGAAGVPSTTRATAELAVYDGDADAVTLTGHPTVAGEGSSVAADRIVLEHGSGDATATGMVKASYVRAEAGGQTGGAEPVHVLADRAEMQQGTGRAIFHGGAGRPARLWQKGSQVEAPVIDLDQQQRSVTAHGEAGGDDAVLVHAVLAGTGKGEAATKPARGAVVRVGSRLMVYREEARTVEFTSGVKVEDADGTMRAREATAYLAAAGGASAPKKDSGGVFGGGVERIVGIGGVEIEQPGRRAMGEQLVYTAADGMFVLTGTPQAAPRLSDEVRGTVTGAELRFHTGDNGVVVVSHAGQAARTETRVKQK